MNVEDRYTRLINLILGLTITDLGFVDMTFDRGNPQLSQICNECVFKFIYVAISEVF